MLRQEFKEPPARQIAAAETRDVRRVDLAVDQRDAVRQTLLDQPRECHLRCVGCAAEHRFAEEYASQAESVETADELAASPGFDGMGMTEGVQFAVAP